MRSVYPNTQYIFTNSVLLQELTYVYTYLPWRRKWQSTPIFVPGKSHGQSSLVGYNPGGCKELDMTEQPNNKNTYIYVYVCVCIHTHIYIYVCIHIHTYTYMCMYVCIHIHTYTYMFHSNF